MVCLTSDAPMTDGFDDDEEQPVRRRERSRLPSRAEISAACAEIRAGWTAADWKRASTCRPLPWEVPVRASALSARRQSESHAGE
jgi:hypothetical protein